MEMAKTVVTAKLAQFVKDLDNFTGEAKLYKVRPAVKFTRYDWHDGADRKPVEMATEYVAVSAIISPFSGAETYIFPADKDGEIISWGELDGSYRGGLDHEQALLQGGYTIVKEA
jgi:hypothetical protein